MSDDPILEHSARQARADGKIRRHAADMARPGTSMQQEVDDRQLMNEMRHNKAALDLNRALLDYDRESERVDYKSARVSTNLTPRQAEVMANLAFITTDGSRHEPQYRLKDKNVSVQVRSLLNFGLVALQDGCLVKLAVSAARTAPKVDTEAAVSDMRDLLGGGAKTGSDR